MPFLTNSYRFAPIGGFSPIDVGNMEFWYDASAMTASTNTNEANTVDGSSNFDRLWDFSEQTNHASNTSSIIKYKANVLSSKPSIDIPQSTTDEGRLNGYTPSYALDTANYSFVIVAQRSIVSASYRGIISNRTTTASNGWFTFGQMNTNVIQVEGRNSSGGVSNITSSFNPNGQGPQIYIYRKSNTTGASLERISSNSIVNLGTNALTTGGGVSNLQFHIGKWYVTQNNQGWYGDVFEIMYFKKYLTDDDILNIKDYIQDKWSITP